MFGKETQGLVVSLGFGNAQPQADGQPSRGQEKQGFVGKGRAPARLGRSGGFFAQMDRLCNFLNGLHFVLLQLSIGPGRFP